VRVSEKYHQRDARQEGGRSGGNRGKIESYPLLLPSFWLTALWWHFSETLTWHHLYSAFTY
jgi:hypothetical protein